MDFQCQEVLDVSFPPNAIKMVNVPHRELLLNNNQLRVLPFELGKLFQLQTLGLKGEWLINPFVAIPASKSHGCLRHDSIHIAVLPSPGNPLAQEIMSLYQEPDGTRRLLNYLLDNLAGTIKRSKYHPSLLLVGWVSAD